MVADTTRNDCGTLPNEATASADNNDDVMDSASIDVTCPVIRIQKVNNQISSVLPGTNVTYTLTVTVSDGPALNAEVIDTLPAGLDDSDEHQRRRHLEQRRTGPSPGSSPAWMD